ncbi:MAG: FISUMP domain-containing protein, partial [Flavobacteriales bacterium]
MKKMFIIMACLMKISSFCQPLSQNIILNSGGSIFLPIDSLSTMSFDATNVIFQGTNGSVIEYARSSVDSVVIVPSTLSSIPHSCGEPNIHNPSINYGSVQDVDGISYKTVVIGNQEWMAENLMSSHFNNGDEIPLRRGFYDDGFCSNSGFESSREPWAAYVGEAFSDARDIYGPSPMYFDCPSPFGSYVLSNCPYGYLYSGYTLEDSRGLCPAGWHIPSADEWQELSNFLGGGV